MTPHEVLGIRQDATEEDARAAYKRLASRHHPDKGGEVSKFQQLRHALTEFVRKIPCPLCAGKGVVETRRGLGVTRENCPKCWRTK